MNFIIRFFSIFSLLIALFFSACAGENEQTVKAVEKLLIKEKIVETVSSSEGGMTVSYADVLDLATPSVVAVYTSKYQRVQSSRMPNGIPDIFRQFGFPVPEIYGEPNAKPEEEKEQHIASLAFHSKLSDFGKNKLLGFIIGFMSQILTELTLYKKLYEPPNFELWSKGREHQLQLIDALDRGDTTKAREIMTSHMQIAETLMKQQEAQIVRRFIAE